MSALTQIQQESASMEAFSEHLAEVGWQLDYCQLDRDIAPSSMTMSATPAAAVAHFKVGSAIHHRIGSPEGMSTFGVLAGRQADTRIGARRFRPGDMLHAHSDDGLDAVIGSGFDGFVLNFADLSLEQLAHKHDLGLPGRGGSEREIAGEHYRAILNMLADIEQLAGQAHVPQWDVLDMIENDLPLLVLKAWSNAKPDSQISRRSRTQACQRAVEYIRGSGGEVRTVHQLCDVAAASYSTLERGFRENYGLSPKQYLVRSRMAGARRALIRGDHGGLITDIAYQWGFTHMGKFAADYRALYGELPSQTLRMPG